MTRDLSNPINGDIVILSMCFFLEAWHSLSFCYNNPKIGCHLPQMQCVLSLKHGNLKIDGVNTYA